MAKLKKLKQIIEQQFKKQCKVWVCVCGVCALWWWCLLSFILKEVFLGGLCFFSVFPQERMCLFFKVFVKKKKLFF